MRNRVIITFFCMSTPPGAEIEKKDDSSFYLQIYDRFHFILLQQWNKFPFVD